MADRVGQQLGNYRLIRLLGEGGFAEVYLGEHIHLNTQAAIKVLHTQLASDAVEKFRTEARTVAHLLHPSIVRILDFGIEGRTPFLVMDYAPQGTLRQRHPKGTQLPITTIVTYAKQLAEALQYAHNEKLIHRDVKPENMLVGRRNEVLLSDFGIAIVAQSSSYPRTLDMAGTIAYMSPEQIHAHPRPASDQYSLGIVVYEWLSGDRPFHGSFTEIAIKHCNVLPPSLREKVPTISPSIEQVVMKALAKNPKERFENVQEFINALEQANQLSNPVFIKPLPPKKRLAVNSPPLGTVLVTYYGHKTYAHVITWSPDGKYIASGSSDGTVQVWDAATGHNFFTYKGHSRPVQASVWSPDGMQIASVALDDAVHIWQAASYYAAFQTRVLN